MNAADDVLGAFSFCGCCLLAIVVIVAIGFLVLVQAF